MTVEASREIPPKPTPETFLMCLFLRAPNLEPTCEASKLRGDPFTPLNKARTQDACRQGLLAIREKDAELQLSPAKRWHDLSFQTRIPNKVSQKAPTAFWLAVFKQPGNLWQHPFFSSQGLA